MLIVGVQAQHTALHLVHDVGRGGIHGIHETVGQGPVLGQQLAEIVQLLLRGQTAEEQQPDDLFEHEAVIAVRLVDDLVDVHTPVDQFARNGDDLPLLILAVAHNVADVGQACQHTGAIRIAQAPFDPQPLAGLRVDVVVGKILFTERPHRLRIQSCHLCMGKIHARIPLSVPITYTFPCHPP